MRSSVMENCICSDSSCPRSRSTCGGGGGGGQGQQRRRQAGLVRARRGCRGRSPPGGGGAGSSRGHHCMPEMAGRKHPAGGAPRDRGAAAAAAAMQPSRRTATAGSAAWRPAFAVNFLPPPTSCARCDSRSMAVWHSFFSIEFIASDRFSLRARGGAPSGLRMCRRRECCRAATQLAGARTSAMHPLPPARPCWRAAPAPCCPSRPPPGCLPGAPGAPGTPPPGTAPP
jgi:hypothetical protein